MTTPAAYLRKSKDTVTKADHLAILMDTVKAFGHNGDTVVYDDWAKSGDVGKLSKRTAWRELCAAIELGDHDVVFMNDLDRGGRSIEEWARFMRVARDSGVRVIAAGVDWAAPERKLEFHIRASFAEEELDRAKARSARTVQIRERRGDVVTGGHAAPYGHRWVRAGEVGMDGDPRRVVEIDNPDEPMEPLLEAIKATKGNVLRAARRLNAEGVPTRSGRPWDSRVLTRALDRAGALRTRRASPMKRRGAPSDAPLSKLVACHCGALMTPSRDRRNGQWLELVCAPGRKAGFAAHGRLVARSRHVMDTLRAEIPKRSTIAILKSAPDTSKRRADLEDERERLGWALADGLLNRDQVRARVAKIASELDELAEVESDWIGLGPRVPNVDWSADDATLGDQLRRIVRVVRLGEDMTPVEVELKGTRATARV